LLSRTLPLILGLLVAIPISARSATIRVPADQPTIQAGIDGASIGDTVLVAPATYTGPSNKNLDFRAKNIVLRSESGPNATIIDCEGVGRGFFLAGGLTNAAVISGVTVINGNSGAGNEGGGGMIVLGCSPTIVDCNFADNWARSTSNSGGGGGIAFYSSFSAVSRCSFMRNEAQGDPLPIGGAVAAQSSQLAVTDCIFSDNTVMGPGGVGGALCGVFFFKHHGKGLRVHRQSGPHFWRCDRYEHWRIDRGEYVPK
jgi:hypothetical protein